METNSFQQKSKHVIDRITRLTDGAGADRYTLQEFFQLINQQSLYRIYEPRLPNDEGLFKLWKTFLEENNNIEFLLHHQVILVHYDENTNNATGVKVIDRLHNQIVDIKCKELVLAVPPQAIVGILKNSHPSVKNAFTDYQQLVEFANHTEYIQYISITFHWKDRLELPNVHGFPWSEWGIASIVMTDYMTFKETVSKTLISCCITYTDRKSSFTGKTADQSTKDEVIQETLRQLRLTFPSLPNPDVSLISPLDQHNQLIGKWQTKDRSYISSSMSTSLSFCGKVRNFYNVGTHNGQCEYQFSTLESAVSNAISLSHLLNKATRTRYRKRGLWTVSKLIRISVVLFILVWIGMMYIRNINLK